MTEDDRILKEFLEEHFDFYEMTKAGVFKGLKKSDIHGQAARICKLFNYNTVFEYGAKVIHAHLSYVEAHRPLHVNENGELKTAPFVERFGGIYDD